MLETILAEVTFRVWLPLAPDGLELLPDGELAELDAEPLDEAEDEPEPEVVPVTWSSWPTCAAREEVGPLRVYVVPVALSLMV